MEQHGERRERPGRRAGGGASQSTSMKSPSGVSQRSRRYATSGRRAKSAGTIVCAWLVGSQSGAR
ncbi:hypothetical protein BOC59_15690 [Burkholderia pseudomallei]|nr:hypothetical protein BOC59_15690 [Burkholderia pseudomallei]